jgi:hypothetical protein
VRSFDRRSLYKLHIGGEPGPGRADLHNHIACASDPGEDVPGTVCSDEFRPESACAPAASPGPTPTMTPVPCRRILGTATFSRTVRYTVPRS